MQLRANDLSRDDFHDVAVWIVEIGLPRTVGPLLQLGGDRDALPAGNFQRLSDVRHGEGDVMAAGDNCRAAIAPARLARFNIRLRSVDLYVADLKPQARETKCGPRNFRHAQQVDIEPARGVEIGADQRDMIEAGDADGGWFFHLFDYAK